MFNELHERLTTPTTCHDRNETWTITPRLRRLERVRDVFDFLKCIYSLTRPCGFAHRNVRSGVPSTRHDDRKHRSIEENQAGERRGGRTKHCYSRNQSLKGIEGRECCQVRQVILSCLSPSTHGGLRLLEIVHAESKLYLVFEFLDMDLKRFIESGNSAGQPITLDLVKARTSSIQFINFHRVFHAFPRVSFTHTI